VRPFVQASFCLVFAAALYGADQLAAVRADLQHLAIDPSETWRVRDLELSKGGTKIYLTEGVLAFATPVDGRRIAAVFTATSVEAGDAEIIALPPVTAERTSLARFTQSPNLDEHLSEALLFFADNTGQDLLKQIHEHPLHPAPELAAAIGAEFGDSLRKSGQEIDVRIAQSILDRHSPANSFFYGMLAGRTLGFFDFVFQPDQHDSVLFGRIAKRASEPPFFQIWASFHARDMAEPPTVYHLTDYHVDTTIQPDLTMLCTADFDYRADTDDGAVISLLLTPRMHVTSATIDGVPASVLMHDSPLTADVRGATTFLLVSATELAPGSHHRVQVQYAGSVIRRTSEGNYFVDDRNAWYPFMAPMLTFFDLTFHCPQNLRLVSTGEPISEEVVKGQRMIHRRTSRVEALAGFNLGDFNITTSEYPPYSIEICVNPQAAPPPDLAEQSAAILKYYSGRWMPLPLHNLAVTPIEGYFGQGFPGLIYLSNISYIREGNRPLGLRNAALDSFFSQLLLPHELAHQWWGNIVTPGDYRGNWIVEGMANYSALQYLEQSQGSKVSDAILADYRADLIRPRDKGELIDSFGPVTFDERLLNNFGVGPWHDILYEKGTWIFHMLRERMGASAFHEFQLRVLKDFASRPISNEDLRQEAAHFIPAHQPDRDLTSFFDTWVYGTGIPELAVKNGRLRLSGVPDGFSVDVPLQCGSGAVPTWLRAAEEESDLPAHGCSLPPTANFLYR
jgi:hypothetical protein